MKLPQLSVGIGDRFAHQGKAQLAAFKQTKALGVAVTPVWNKSNREHLIVHSEPQSVRDEADAAVKALEWRDPYFVDADHIGLKTVDRFIGPSDFFTIDVADLIGKPAGDDEIAEFTSRHRRYATRLDIDGIHSAVEVNTDRIEMIARKYLAAVKGAGEVYRRIAADKGQGRFVSEVSMDETDEPQSPIDLLFILAAIAAEKIPVQTIAPKFSGRFNKGVDYVGDVTQFEREFRDDIAVIGYAIKEFGLPANLKLSVHSGSDKFSIYPAIRRAVRETGAGVHVKTAGTTWLEELIGLAEAEGEGAAIAREVYGRAFERFDELCGPYASVIDIDRGSLPAPRDVAQWSGSRFASALRHDPSSPDFNPHVRQLLHVGYKVAAEMSDRFIDALLANEAIVGRNVTENLFERHLKPLFIDD